MYWFCSGSAQVNMQSVNIASVVLRITLSLEVSHHQLSDLGLLTHPFLNSRTETAGNALPSRPSVWLVCDRV